MSNKMLSIAIAVVIATTFFICANEVRTKVVTDKLVSYWTCDKVSIKSDVLEYTLGESYEN